MAGHAKPRLVVIAGPTGAGKTAVAVALARLLPIEVISADSRQVYRGMDAATGKPTAEERAAVVHHLIDVVDPDDRYQAARFRGDAATLVERIRARDAVPVVVGGTGLYIRALVRGLDTAPAADPSFRRELAAIARREGRPALWERLRSLAPEIAARLHPNDEVRVIRALEIVRGGGRALYGAGGRGGSRRPRRSGGGSGTRCARPSGSGPGSRASPTSSGSTSRRPVARRESPRGSRASSPRRGRRA